jgi:hypothetical protein
MGAQVWVYVEVTLARTKYNLIGQLVRSMAVTAEPGLSIDTEPVISFSGPRYVYVKAKSFYIRFVLQYNTTSSTVSDTDW